MKQKTSKLVLYILERLMPIIASFLMAFLIPQGGHAVAIAVGAAYLLGTIFQAMRMGYNKRANGSHIGLGLILIGLGVVLMLLKGKLSGFYSLLSILLLIIAGFFLFVRVAVDALGFDLHGYKRGFLISLLSKLLALIAVICLLAGMVLTAFLESLGYPFEILIYIGSAAWLLRLILVVYCMLKCEYSVDDAKDEAEVFVLRHSKKKSDNDPE